MGAGEGSSGGGGAFVLPVSSWRCLRKVEGFRPMRHIAYMGTDGEVVIDPTDAEMRRFISLGRDYWHGGSGSAWVAPCERSGRSQKNSWGASGGWAFHHPILHLIVHKPCGIHLKYAESGDKPDVVSYDSSQPTRRLKHYLGGNAVLFPRRSFVDVDVGEHAIAHFLRTAKQPSSITWRKGWFQNDRFVFDDH